MDKTVINPTGSTVEVMWDGAMVVFGPGQKKLMSAGIADGIVADSKDVLKIEEEVVEVAEVAEDAEVAPEEDVYTETTTKKGAVQYKKNGKLIKKAEYEAAQK